ncbi:MAG: hypothetical protein ABWY20_23835 [Mycobacterium sp.]
MKRDPLEAELLANIRRQRGPQGILDARTRARVMRELIDAISERYERTGEPDPSDLVRFAAHAFAWAHEIQTRQEHKPTAGQQKLI